MPLAPASALRAIKIAHTRPNPPLGKPWRDGAIDEVYPGLTARVEHR